MDAENRQRRSTPGSGQWGEPPPVNRPGQFGATSRSSTTLAPLIPRFAWSPRHSDFPLPFPGSEQATIPAASLRERRDETPASVPLAPSLLRYAPLALILLAVTALAVWQLGGDDGSEGEQGSNGANRPAATRTPTTQGQAGAVVTQRPGSGGAAGTSTVGADATASAAEETAASSAGADEPATDDVPEPSDGGEPEIIDPADLGVITVESQEGESLADVAARWGLDVATLVWANDIDDPISELEAGTLVVVPPVDGVVHEVVEGETIESIAALYQLDPTAITSVIQNRVTTDEDLQPGKLIAVYGAEPRSRDSIATYTVREGDDLFLIASYYGLDASTIAAANNLPDSLLIYPGQELQIPPADGVLVYAGEGDTVELIAEIFGVEPELIRSVPFNALPGDAQPVPGQPILVPGIEVLSQPAGKGGSVPPAADPFVAATPMDAPPAQATGSFVWPAQGWISQWFGEGHNGLDIANSAWTPVIAADGGVVTFAGWNDWGLGYAVAIDHENGLVTWYGHFVEPPAVVSGQRVSQGDWLGGMGSTGKSTGPHVHFIIMRDGVYQDPAGYLP